MEVREIEITASLISNADFCAFGDIIQLGTLEPKSINQGNCLRFNNLAKMEHDPGGQLGISIFESKIRPIPYRFNLVERHPHGPQFFFPMDNQPFLVVVAPDQNGTPGLPRAFITERYQGINFHRGTWHGVLTPIRGTGKFLVFDWIGTKVNLEEHKYPNYWKVFV